MLLGQPLLGQWVRQGRLTAEAMLVAPGLFALFLVIHGVDRFFLAKKSRKNAPAWALAQVSLGVLFLAFIVPSNLREYRTRKVPEQALLKLLPQLERSRDARVRALVMLAAPSAAEDRVAMVQVLRHGLADPDPLVRHAARVAVERRAGRTLADGEEGLAEAGRILNSWLVATDADQDAQPGGEAP
jgi:hypothetical protein